MSDKLVSKHDQETQEEVKQACAYQNRDTFEETSKPTYREDNDDQIIQTWYALLQKLEKEKLPYKFETREEQELFGSQCNEIRSDNKIKYTIILDYDYSQEPRSVMQQYVEESLQSKIEKVIQQDDSLNINQHQDNEKIKHLIIIPSRNSEYWIVMILVLEVKNQEVIEQQIQSLTIKNEDEDKKVNLLDKQYEEIDLSSQYQLINQKVFDQNDPSLLVLNSIKKIGDSIFQKYQLKEEFCSDIQKEIHLIIKKAKMTIEQKRRKYYKQQCYLMEKNRRKAINQLKKKDKGQEKELSNDSTMISLKDNRQKPTIEDNIGDAFTRLFQGTGLKFVKYILTKFAADVIGEMLTNQFLSEFQKQIQYFFQSNSTYIQQRGMLEDNLKNLIQEISSYYQNQNTIMIMKQILEDVERELNTQNLNKIILVLEQIPKIMEGVIFALKYYGLKKNGEKIENKRNEELKNLKESIHTVIKIFKYATYLSEILTVFNTTITKVNKRVKQKLDTLQQERSIQTKIKAQTSSFTVIRSEIDNLLQMMDNKIFMCFKINVAKGFINPMLTSLINSFLVQTDKTIEEIYFNDFKEMVEIEFATSAYLKIVLNNMEEIGENDYCVKDYIVNKLQTFKYSSPLQEVNLEGLKTGKYFLQINGKIDEYDMSNELHKNILRDRIGSIGIRILKGNTGFLSRPDYKNYLKSWTLKKQVNELDLQTIASYLNQQIELHSKNEGDIKYFGPQNNKPPLLLQHIKSDNDNESSHFRPIVKDSQGNLNPIIGLPNNFNACGVESVLYLLNRQDYQGLQKYTEEQIDELAREKIKIPKYTQQFINDVCQWSYTNQTNLYVFVNRSHEDKAVGGQDSRFITVESSKNFYEASFQSNKYKQLTEQALEIYRQKTSTNQKINYEKFENILNKKFHEINIQPDELLINGIANYGGFHELLPRSMVSYLFKRSCGLNNKIESYKIINGKYYNWLHLQNALRVQTSTIIYKNINDNKLTTGTGHPTTNHVQTKIDYEDEEKHKKNSNHKVSDSNDIYHNKLKEIVKNSTNLDNAIKDLIHYHLTNTKNESDNPANDMKTTYANPKKGTQNKETKQNYNDSFNKSVTCARNDLKRILLQQKLFKIREDKWLIEINGSRSLTPLGSGTPRTDKKIVNSIQQMKITITMIKHISMNKQMNE